MNLSTNFHRILGLILIPLSYLCFLNKRRWMVGSNMGYTGIPKHLFIYVNENFAGSIDAYWITDKKSEFAGLKSLGIPVAYKWSFNGIILALTAKVYFYNSYVSDINEYTFGNVVRFNLWHGVALKHIERTKKHPEKKYVTNNPFVKLRYFRFLIRPTFVLTSSPTQTELFARSFDVKLEQCVEAIYPRNKILNYSTNELREYIIRNENNPNLLRIFDKMHEFDHRIIYMPTWRDSGRNFLKQIGLDLIQVNRILKDINGCLLLKLHPATKLDIDVSKLSNVILLDRNIDIYPLLPLTDCLLTDYSSIYFDYVLMNNKRVIFYIPDFEKYTNGDRDFAFPFQTSIEGEMIYDFSTLIESLKQWDSVFRCKPYSNESFWKPTIKDNRGLIKFVANKINLSV